MPQDMTPPAQGPMQDAGAQAQESSNANLLNRQLSAVIEAMSDGSTNVLTALASIASAITASIIGGTTGVLANHVLVSKGTTGRALQATPATIDPSTGALTLPVPLAIASGGTNGATATAGFDNLAPTTAQGDVIYRNATVNTNLAAGTAYHFLRTNGVAANPSWNGALALLATGSGSGATMDILLTDYTGFYGIQIKMVITPATDDTILQCRFSTDGGANYLATGYNYALLAATDVPTVGGTGNGNTTQINFLPTSAGTQIGNGSTEGWHGDVELLSQTSTAFWPRIRFSGYFISAAATPAGSYMTGGGSNEAANDVNAIRFLMSSGNITYTYRVYGII